MDALPVEAFLEQYPAGIRSRTRILRDLVHRATPDVIERVRPGWRLIGYDIPVGRRTAYFAYIAPEPEHVHLGFEYGAWLRDPDGLLEGAHLRLRQVRYVTYRPGERVPVARLEELVRAAAALATMSREERLALATPP